MSEETQRILVADDEMAFLDLLAHGLTQAGYSFDCAPDAESAAALLRAQRYGLVIADIRMPGNADLEFIRDLPRIAEGLPVILMTGYPSLDSAIKSLQLPVVAYLVKPFAIADLLAQVRQALSGSRMTRALACARTRVEEWSHDIEVLERAALQPSGKGSFQPLDTFVKLTVRNMFGCLEDLRRLIEALAQGRREEDLPEAFYLSRVSALAQGLTETISVLERTKGAFKSRELGELRRKLERLVRSGEFQ